MFSRKIRDPATFDFCNTIPAKADKPEPTRMTPTGLRDGRERRALGLFFEHESCRFFTLVPWSGLLPLNRALQRRSRASSIIEDQPSEHPVEHRVEHRAQDHRQHS